MLQCLANSSITQGRQAGHNGKTVAIDWFLKKAKLSDIFRTFFFCLYVFARYGFCEYLACIYFHECRLKENFMCVHFCKIDQNLKNPQKYVHAKISMFKIAGCRIAFFDN